MTETADRPLVTFALFAYNQEQYIREAVEGAFAQTYEPLEIILSDDCSTDRTFEIMQEMAAAYEGPHEVRVRRNSSNLGFADHINCVVNSCNGVYITWAAGDDVSMKSRVELLLRPMLKDPNLVGTYSDIQEIDLDGKPNGKIRRKQPEESKITIFDVIERRFSINTQSHCFQKNAFTAFPPLNSDLTYEAPCMTLREILLGSTEYIPEITVKYRVGSGVSTYSGNDQMRLRILEPAKISEWRRSSAQQMLNDLNYFDPEGYRAEKKKLEQIIRGASRLKRINLHGFRIVDTLLNIADGIFVRETARAFFRRNSPTWVWREFKK